MNIIKIYNIDQRTEEWRRLRAGKFTGSDFHILMGNSETKNNLLLKKTAERMRNTVIEDTYANQDIERGIELEKQAKLIYEMETGIVVNDIGFCEINDWVGCSSDGFIVEGRDEEWDIDERREIWMLGDPRGGIIEIKCPKDTVFLHQIINDKIKPEYYTQIQFNLYVSNRQYCDYIAYNDNYPLFIKRIERDEEYIEKIKEVIEDCKNKVELNMAKAREALGLQ
jgi:putative phage-type endonuclease